MESAAARRKAHGRAGHLLPLAGTVIFLRGVTGEMDKEQRKTSADECGESCLKCGKCAERLTVKDSRGITWLKACWENEECDEACWYCDIMRRAMERLAAYEEERGL